MTATRLQYVQKNDEGQQKIVALEDGTIPSVWIFNTHLGQEEYLKTKSCEKIMEIVRSMTNNLKDPFILCGDFNMFPQLDGNKQYEIFTAGDNPMKPVFAYENLLSPNDIMIPGTFLGYSHDPFCSLEPLKKMSHLDHVFTNNWPTFSREGEGLNFIDHAVVIAKYGSTKQEEIDALHSRDTMPSDHLALFVSFEAIF